ncbi:seven-hairpin glycosidase [Stereum hirsutum FP-91666 SS1]|uniref:seven-hairpin glycosidase n=1 Tax=Stereum hirsutum (strain FP-91666) TaxID=721885 RepID=UPI000440AEF6|nr:seven-hairpin glycosidase [Stereum hirsutum FP-91666 SS1]EIM88924.1 seven-hairpin glycosidase [Stereum hirsutum FP-91666 SS1]
MWSTTLPASLVLLGAPLVLGADVQLQGLTVPSQYASQGDAVKQIFTDSYNSYKKFAFGHDEVEPISETFTDPRNGWGASIVDGMTTMFIMGLDDFFDEALNFSQRIDFNVSNVDETVSVFESTIRYVASLISTYELSGKQHPELIERAKDLGNKLSVAWSAQNTIIPYGELNFTTDTAEIDTSNIAEAGTLSMEFDRLSLYTGNDTYRKLAVGSVKEIISLPAPLPGFPAQGIDPGTNKPVGAYVTWGGGSDSYLEYLIKYARLTNTEDNSFTNAWLTAVDSSIHTLLRTSTVGDHVYLADQDDDGLIRHIGSHLACFMAGNWIMGGRLTNNQTIVDIGLKLNDACWNTYAGDATGIGPEAFAWISDETNGSFTGGSAPDSAQLAFYNQNGYYVTTSDYVQRPEVLESNFYAWRATGDTKYLDRAAAAVDSFQKFLKVDTGYIGLNDVNDVSGDPGNLVDDTASFWFAEVLKYLFLTFDDPSHISLNDFVFNTEAHPFAAPPAQSTYGNATLLSQTAWQIQQTGPLPAISTLAFPLPTSVTIGVAATAAVSV